MEKQGNGVAVIAMVALATVFFFIQLAAGGGMNWGLYAIVFCRPAVLAWVKWSKLALILCIALDKKFEDLFYFG